MEPAARLAQAAERLCAAVAELRFGPPVSHVYNPLVYARRPHDLYLQRHARAPLEVLFLGMNPGPWGMVQTGVPFGEVAAVRDWLGIEAPVGKPPREHPKHPVHGFACRRSEVSGRRLWGWARQLFVRPERFFQRCFVSNYCPLAFFEDGGRNRTPDQLPAAERAPLFAACDAALRETVAALQPRWLIGVGEFAARRAREALDGTEIRIGAILHPSPASPAANRGWAEQAEAQLRRLGADLP